MKMALSRPECQRWVSFTQACSEYIFRKQTSFPLLKGCNDCSCVSCGAWSTRQSTEKGSGEQQCPEDKQPNGANTSCIMWHRWRSEGCQLNHLFQTMSMSLLFFTAAYSSKWQLILPVTAIFFFLEFEVLHPIHKWEKCCNLPLVLLDTLGDGTDTSCPAYKQFNFSNRLRFLGFGNILDTEKN